jgi:hypothetical protein
MGTQRRVCCIRPPSSSSTARAAQVVCRSGCYRSTKKCFPKAHAALRRAPPEIAGPRPVPVPVFYRSKPNTCHLPRDALCNVAPGAMQHPMPMQRGSSGVPSGFMEPRLVGAVRYHIKGTQRTRGYSQYRTAYLTASWKALLRTTGAAPSCDCTSRISCEGTQGAHWQATAASGSAQS